MKIKITPPDARNKYWSVEAAGGGRPPTYRVLVEREDVQEAIQLIFEHLYFLRSEGKVLHKLQTDLDLQAQKIDAKQVDIGY
jgi:hypothetical protein